MSTVLVEPDEIAAFLGIEEGEYPSALDPVRLGAIRLFERLTGRKSCPFAGAFTARVEYHDGTGDGVLLLDYPPAGITSITIGANHEAPDETVSSEAYVVVAGDREITRLDGGTFGEFDAKRRVRVTYDTQDDRPEDAQLAVMRLIAQVWRQRGTEDAASETVSGYSRTMADIAATDGVFVAAVRAHSRPVMV